MQLMFENGAVLPVEMSVDAGAALSEGLEGELPKRQPAVGVRQPEFNPAPGSTKLDGYRLSSVARQR